MKLSPFGRFKQSGVALQMGMAGLEESLERKTFAVPVSGVTR
jgi:aldehyde dehydrogenase (NAD+)